MQIDSLIKHMISINNYNFKFAIPAIVVGVSNLKDGLIDVLPIVNSVNHLTWETTEHNTLYDIPVVFPSTSNSSICFPVNQGDTVELILQSSDIIRFRDGNKEQHDPSQLGYNNLANCIALVGFAPFQESCFNPNNYKNDFDNQDLNIVHNKNSGNEANIVIKSDGSINILSNNKVDINGVIVTADGDIQVNGKSLRQFMLSHTHIDSQGASTTPPQNT